MFALGAFNKVDEITKDGWQWLSDSVALFPTLVEIPAIIKDGKETWQQFQDVDAEEKATLLAKAKAKFDIADDVLEDVVESAFDWLYQTAETAKKVKDALKKD